jgi:hypothetical protein
MSSTMQNGVPAVPHVLGESVADRLEALLARVDGTKRASTLKPKTFTERAYRDATAKAQVPENDTCDGGPPANGSLEVGGAVGGTRDQPTFLHAQL